MKFARVLIAGMLVVTAACGDDDSDESPTASSPTASASDSSTTAAASDTTVVPSTAPDESVTESSTVSSGSTATTVGGAAEPTGEPIKIGYYTWGQESAATFYQAVGFKLPPKNDFTDYADLLAEDLNSRGGILGRPVEVVAQEVDLGDPNGGQQGCATFTQDNQVDAVVAMIQVPEALLECVSDRPMVAEIPASTFYVSTFEENPYLVWPENAEYGRTIDPLVDSLVEQGYFESWDVTQGAPGSGEVKVGTMYADLPETKALVDGALTEALERNGLTLEVAVPIPVGDQAAAQAAFQGAVTQLVGRGVTHLVVFDGSAIQFGPAAASQNYRPRLGLSTHGWPQGIHNGLWPAESLVGAMGIGWLPAIDLPDGNAFANETNERCRDLVLGGGFDLESSVDENFAMWTCEGFWILEEAFSAGGGTTADDFIAGINGAGDSIESVYALGMTFSEDQHDGAALYRQMRYTGPDTGFEYLGDDLPF